jgi:hypothetical protein
VTQSSSAAVVIWPRRAKASKARNAVSDGSDRFSTPNSCDLSSQEERRYIVLRKAAMR